MSNLLKMSKILLKNVKNIENVKTKLKQAKHINKRKKAKKMANDAKRGKKVQKIQKGKKGKNISNKLRLSWVKLKFSSSLAENQIHQDEVTITFFFLSFPLRRGGGVRRFVENSTIFLFFFEPFP